MIQINTCRDLYERGGLKNGNHELEMARDAVKQDVLLKLILVMHVGDLEQKRNNNNKKQNDQTTKNKNDNDSWQCCEEGCLPQAQLGDLQNDNDENNNSTKLG